MTCRGVAKWLHDHEAVAREVLEADPTREEILVALAAHNYPDMDYVTALVSRLPDLAVRLIAEAWLLSISNNGTVDPRNNLFVMNSVGPDEDPEEAQVPQIPAMPDSGLAITLHFDGDAQGKVSVYFHGQGVGEDYFSHETDRFNNVSPMWFSSTS